MFKTLFTKTALWMCLAVQAACSFLPVKAPDAAPPREDAVCGKNPLCRKLTDNEITLAKTVFGDSIDYQRVRFIHKPYSLLRLFTDAMAPDGHVHIYAPSAWADDYTKLSRRHVRGYMHEMTHVWQSQRGMNLTSLGISSIASNLFNFSAVYNYVLQGDKPFEKYDFEQQAQIVQDYVDSRMDWQIATDEKNKSCDVLTLYEKILTSSLHGYIQPVCFKPKI